MADVVLFENDDLRVMRDATGAEWKEWKPGSGPAVFAAITEGVEQGLAQMQQIIDTPAVTFSNLAQAQTAVQQIQTAIKAEARQIRRLSRLALNRLDGTD